MGAKIYNSNLTKEIIDGAKLQVAQGGIPSEIAEKVIPVMEVNPKLFPICNIVEGSGWGTTGTKILYTTPSDKDFYLSTLNYNLKKDVLCDVATGNLWVSGIINGNTKYLIEVSVITLTAEEKNITLCFPIPIKLDRNTAITISGTFGAGVFWRTASITGYTIDNIRA